MRCEIVRCVDTLGGWRVETEDESSGDTDFTYFNGPYAKEQAEAYVARRMEAAPHNRHVSVDAPVDQNASMTSEDAQLATDERELLRSLLDQASDRPWIASQNYLIGGWWIQNGPAFRREGAVGDFYTNEDAMLVAHVVNRLGSILDYVDDLEKQLHAAQAASRAFLTVALRVPLSCCD